jgi:hypothetical protein
VFGSAAAPKAEIAVRLTAAPDSSPSMLRLRKSRAQWPVLDFRALRSSRAAWRTALRLANQSRKLSHVAFANTDGSKAVVIGNLGAERPIRIFVAGKMAQLTLPTDSLVTLSWR